jgi:hypothetical protein
MASRTPESERVARLIEKAVRTLPEREQRHVLTFLLRAWLDLRFGQMQPPGALEAAVMRTVPGSLGVIPGTASMPVVASGPEHQTLPVRLPDEQHARLKAWCAEHGFSMATVVRGLVENFLQSQMAAGASE